MANRYRKRCLASLNIREMHIKFIMKYKLTPGTMASSQKTRNKYWKGCEDKETLIHHWWEYKLVQLLWEIIWWIFKKLKIELPFDPAILFLCIYSKNKVRY